MRKLLILLLTLSITNVWSQKADNIIENYIQKLGGEKLDQVHSIFQKGSVNMNGMTFPMENYQSDSGVIYTKINMNGNDIITVAFDGKKGYRFNGFGYEDIPDSLANQYQEKAKNLFGYFYKYKDTGKKVRYLGKEKFDDVEAESLQLTFDKPIEGGLNKLNAYFNPATGLLMGVKVKKDGHTVITKFSDFKEFDGISFMTKISIEVDGTVFQSFKTDSIKINPPAPDSKVFIKPKK